MKIQGGADTTKPFYYLAGRMSGIPGFNFPAFDAAADYLRTEHGLNIVNPAELDHEIVREVAAESANGSKEDLHEAQSSWEDCLRRDLLIILDLNCVGIIAMEDWEQSKGARFETYTAAALGISIWEFESITNLTKPDEWVRIDRVLALEEAGVADEV